MEACVQGSGGRSTASCSASNADWKKIYDDLRGLPARRQPLVPLHRSRLRRLHAERRSSEQSLAQHAALRGAAAQRKPRAAAGFFFWPRRSPPLQRGRGRRVRASSPCPCRAARSTASHGVVGLRRRRSAGADTRGAVLGTSARGARRWRRCCTCISLERLVDVDRRLLGQAARDQRGEGDDQADHHDLDDDERHRAPVDLAGGDRGDRACR